MTDRRFLIRGKDPPVTMRVKSSTVKVLPPESPISTEPSPTEDFVDLKNTSRQQIPVVIPQVWSGRLKQHKTEGFSTNQSFIDPKKTSLHCSKYKFKPQLQVQQDDGDVPELPSASKQKAFNAENLHLPKMLEDDLGWDDCVKFKDQKSAPQQFYPQLPRFSDSVDDGKVQLCSKKGLEELLHSYEKLKQTTGVITDENFFPDGDRYEENAHFIVLKNLGVGAFGNVDLCIDSNSKQQFVRKEVKKSSFSKSEVSVPSQLQHPNITKLYGLIFRPAVKEGKMELMIEYAGQALNRYVIKHRGMWKSKNLMWDLCKQGFQALAHLNRYGITHLDIKPENLCVMEQRHGYLSLKLTDFGSARLSQDPMKYVGLTPEYLAPELSKLVLQIRHKELNFGLTEDDITGKADMFSFGLVIMYIYKGYHILQKLITNGQTSYDKYNDVERQLLHMQLLIQLAKDTNFVTNLIPDECELDMRDLLSKIVEHDPKERYSAKEALKIIEVLDKREEEEYERMDKMAHTRTLTEITDFGIKFPDDVSDSPPYSPEGLVPDIAGECMECEYGPIKNSTKDKLRSYLTTPYCPSKSFKGSSKGRTAQHRGVTSKTLPSKRMPDMSPMSPMQEFTALKKEVGIVEKITGVTESNAPIAQPSMDTDANQFTMGPPVMSPEPVMINIQQLKKLWAKKKAPASTPMRTDAIDVDLSRRNVPQPFIGERTAPSLGFPSPPVTLQAPPTRTSFLPQPLNDVNNQTNTMVMRQLKKMLQDNQQLKQLSPVVHRLVATTEDNKDSPMDMETDYAPQGNMPCFDRL